MRRYRIVLEPLSAEDGGGWAATVPALNGCMGDGDTPLEALLDVEAAIDEWIDEAVKSGIPFQQPQPD